jgi:predicted dinucleotide-utilizing enzyme
MKNLINHLKAEWYKYLLEIIVITVGILGAFILNSWNEGRKNAVEERVVLENLITEIKANKKQLERMMQRMDVAANGSYTLMNLCGPKPQTVHLDSIQKLIKQTAINSTFRPGQGVILDVINSGKLVLIKNEKLRQLLSNLPSLILDSQDDEEAIYEVRERYLIPYLEDKLNFHGTTRVDSTKFEITNVDFLADLVFQNRVSRLHYQLRFIKGEYQKVHDAQSQMIEIINEELNK